jgi:hypothetical protein
MALLDCIKDTCDAAQATTESLARTRVEAQRLLNEVSANTQVFDCVINGATGQYCRTTAGTTHLTLAEALARVNAMDIGTIARASFVATAGQTVFTLPAAPAGAAALEVELNGVECATPRDWNVSGVTLTFTSPTVAGDEVDVRIFTV